MGVHYSPRVITKGLVGYWPLADYSWTHDGNEVLNSFNWTDSNTDGLADEWQSGYGGINVPTFEITSGSGNVVQRVITTSEVSASGNYYRFSIKTSDSNFNPSAGSGEIYRVTGRLQYSSSAANGEVTLRMGGFTNNQDAKYIYPGGPETWTNFTYEKVYGVSDTNCMFVGQGINYKETGSWFEIDDIQVFRMRFHDIIGSNHGNSFNVPNTGSKSTIFNGTDDRVELSSEINNTAISFWFKTNSSSEQILISRFGDTTTGTIGFRSTKICLTNASQSVSSNLNDGKWHNVVFINSGSYKLYIDGVEDLMEATTFARVSGTITFGCRYSSSTYALFFNGELANVMSYNRELSEEEIWQNYTAMRRRFE